jgi:DNA modification methylase
MACDREIGPYDCCSVVQGDCLELMRQLPDGCVDAVITDPPYGMGKDFANDSPDAADAVTAAAMIQSRRIARGNVVAFWSAQRMEVINSIFQPKRVMIWDKDWAIYTPNNVGYRFEPIVWVRGDSANQMRGDIFKAFPICRKVQEESCGHPTQKPEVLMIELAGDFSLETILDPFTGSGTTLVAAKKLGRHFLGFEISETYVQIARDRLARIDAQPNLFEPKPEQLQLGRE